MEENLYTQKHFSLNMSSYLQSTKTTPIRIRTRIPFNMNENKSTINSSNMSAYPNMNTSFYSKANSETIPNNYNDFNYDNNLY